MAAMSLFGCCCFFIDAVGCFTCDITINGGRAPTRGHKYYVVRVQNCEITERDDEHGLCAFYTEPKTKKQKVKSASRL